MALPDGETRFRGRLKCDFCGFVGQELKFTVVDNDGKLNGKDEKDACDPCVNKINGLKPAVVKPLTQAEMGGLSELFG